MKNVAVVGCGYWGPNLIRNLSQNKLCKLTTCCDLYKSRLSRVHDAYPSITMTTDYKDIIKNKMIDAVVIATPLATHYPIAKAMLEAGKHVMIEKPFTETVAQAESLTKLASKKKLVLMVGHTYLYDPAINHIKKMLQQNELGKVQHIHSTRVNFGRFRPNESVIWDLAPHDLSIIFYWLKHYAYEISCTGRDCMHRNHLDTANITLEFERGGPFVNIFISWLSPIKMRNMSITGSEKMVFLNDMRTTEKIKVYDQCAIRRDQQTYDNQQWDCNMGDVFSPNLESAEPLSSELTDFFTCIDSGGTPRSSGRFSLNVMRAMEAISESLKKNKKIKVQ